MKVWSIDHFPVPPGTEGVVYLPSVKLGEEWVIHVKWDNGSMLNLCTPPDKYEVVT